MAFISRSLLKVSIVSCVFCSGFAVAADDDYLKMLEGEAENVTLDQSGQLKKDTVVVDTSDRDGIESTDWKWEGDLEGELMPEGLAQDEFSKLLKHHFYGTFVFFRKLNSIDQSTVYYQYQKSSSTSLDSIRQNIMDILKK